MNITLAVIGKLKDPALKALYEEYNKRLEWKIFLHEFNGKTSPTQEGELLINVAPVPSYLITLDERGENLKSAEFAALLNNIQVHHQGKVTFVIGGAEGLSPAIKAKANTSLSFGRLTWPHLMVRILLMEQLYRAQQILKGHPYHRK
ncbi:MAG: 23S rRNA (pseudouridine(1915)-N(3))-methyltransferase RlmH [Alphaproteobacteria bacterium]|nr:23S rRNA (pseudouridine(1915)-N(3))-methyltransferase RlmH [Alphaproteobacteria bacterium]